MALQRSTDIAWVRPECRKLTSEGENCFMSRPDPALGLFQQAFLLHQGADAHGVVEQAADGFVAVEGVNV